MMVVPVASVQVRVFMELGNIKLCEHFVVCELQSSTSQEVLRVPGAMATSTLVKPVWGSLHAVTLACW